MKVLINTNYDSAGARVCVDDLTIKFQKADFEVVRNDWDNYQNYDLILFMAPDSQVRKAKKANPKAIVGITVPTITKEREPEMHSADFLLAGSIEHRDVLLKYNKNILIYHMFPEITAKIKKHVQKDKIIIGYHGNIKHLGEMKDIVLVLDELSEKNNIELWAMYNIKKKGLWKKNLPKKCPVKHIQWSEEAYFNELSKADIGIVPARIPSRFFKGFGLKKYDYIIRLKYSTNAGRVYPFSQLGIPVVADFMPSYCQVIQDGESGFLVYSKEGWYYALEQLCLKSDLRQKISDNLRNYIDNHCSPDINFKRFLKFIEDLKK